MRLDICFYLLYFVSGLAGLICEVLFARLLGQLLGASLPACATITGLFLFGLSLGALFGGFLTARLANKQPALWWLAFALAEVLVALLGLSVPVVLSSPVQQALWSACRIEDAALSYAARVLMAALLIVPASACMGATFPFAVQALKNRRHCSQWLYGVNTVGAALGVLIGGFGLLPALGLRATSFVACGFDLCVAAAAVVLSRAAVAAVEGTSPALPPGATAAFSSAWPEKTGARLPSAACRMALLAATISGALALLFQVCWIRLFTLIFGSSTYCLSAFLSVLLLFSGAGSLVVAGCLERLRQPLLVCAAGFLLACLATLTAVYMADSLPWTFIVVSRTAQSVAAGWHIPSMAAALGTRFLLVSMMIAVPALSSGTVVPLLFTLKADGKQAAAFSAWLFAANSSGALLGAFLTGFVVLPFLAQRFTSGIQAGLLIYCLLAAIMAYCFFHAWSAGFVDDKPTRLCINGFVAIMLLSAGMDIAMLRPYWNPGLMSSGAGFYAAADLARIDERTFLHAQPAANPLRASAVLFYREGLNSTVTVEKNSHTNILMLKTDGKAEAALPIAGVLPAPTSDLPTHRLLATLPIGLHEGACRDVLVVGFGTGTTCGAVLENKQVQRLTVAELEPAIYAAAPFFNQASGNPLADPRTTALTNDGRYVLSSSNRLYDAIICQPSDPWVNGSGELFSREFFRLARLHLKPGGVMAQWLPLYCLSPRYLAVLCRTFSAAFPHCALFRHPGAGECILVGGDRRLSLPWIDRGSTWLADDDLDRLCRALGKDSGDYRQCTDDNSLLEFASGQNAIRQRQLVEQNLQAIEQFAKP